MVDFKLFDVVLTKTVDVTAHKASQSKKSAAQYDFIGTYRNYKSAAVHPFGGVHRYCTHQNATAVHVPILVVVLSSLMIP